MLSKSEKSAYRSTIFRHLDGIATATTAYSLHKKGVLDVLLEKKTVSLKALCDEFNANKRLSNAIVKLTAMVNNAITQSQYESTIIDPAQKEKSID